MSIVVVLSPSELLAERIVAQRFSNQQFQIIDNEYLEERLYSAIQPTLWENHEPLLIKHLDQAPKSYITTLIKVLSQVEKNFTAQNQLADKKTLDADFKMAITLSSWTGITDLKHTLQSCSAELVEIKAPKYETERKKFIQDVFGMHSKTITNDSVLVFLEYFPQNLDLLVAIINQIAQESPAKRIDQTLVQEYVSLLTNDDLFTLVDAITSGKRRLVVQELIKRRATLEPMKFLGLLRSKTENLIKAQAVVENQISFEASGLNRWYYNNKLRPEIIQRWTSDRLAQMLQQLQETYRFVLNDVGAGTYALERLALTFS
ncbi:MAG: hypothetical protein LBC43_02475 [Bifidobacteriaceae bacterium]|jgi:DNA polymerase III delta subunit|nr:hypothetical protein [Bifidobacteriaceae bacterium]